MKVNLNNQRKKILNLLEKCDWDNYKDIVAWLDKNNYFIAQASVRFHGDFVGGLAYHSLNVYELLTEKNDRFNLGLSETTIITTTILHDLCKIVKGYKGYEHGLKSVAIIEKELNLTLDEFEIEAIACHMGPFSRYFMKNQFRLLKKYPEILALHTADYESAILVESDERKIKMDEKTENMVDELRNLQGEWEKMVTKKQYSFPVLVTFAKALTDELEQIKTIKIVRGEILKMVEEKDIVEPVVEEPKVEEVVEEELPVEEAPVVEEEEEEEEKSDEE